MRKVKREERRRRRSSKMCSSDSDNLLAPGSQAQMCCWDMTGIHWRIALPLLSFRSLIPFIYQLCLIFNLLSCSISFRVDTNCIVVQGVLQSHRNFPPPPTKINFKLLIVVKRTLQHVVGVN